MCYNILVGTCNVNDNDSVYNAFSYWNKVHFEGNKILFKGSYDKQNLILFAISYAIYGMS